MGVARRRVGVLAEEDGFHPVQRRQTERVENVVRRGQNELARADAPIHPRRHGVGMALAEKRQPHPTGRGRVSPEARQRGRDGSAHRMRMRPSGRMSTVPSLRM